jgi:uncharacterized protein YndB with AHSA1/START domain
MLTWTGKCISHAQMATTVLTHDSIPRHQGGRSKFAGVSLEHSESTIRASVRIKADTRRLFQALVSPEYVETWLILPDQSGSWDVSASAANPESAWECCAAEGRPLRIQAAFTVARRSRLSICWKLERGLQRYESMITLRLIGDFDYSTLSLCHVGFTSDDELAWHWRLWEGSLGRLAKLYEQCPLAC